MPDTITLLEGDRELLFCAGGWLLHLDSAGTARRMDLDTAGVHRCLRDNDAIAIDEPFNYAFVVSDSSLNIFDVHSRDFKLLYRWLAPGPLDPEMHIAGPGECVVRTGLALYHLSWTPRVGFRVLQTIDYDQHGLMNVVDLSTRRSEESLIVFASTPLQGYDTKNRRMVRFQGTSLNDRIIDSDPSADRFLCWTNQPGLDRGAITLRNASGTWSRLIAANADDHDAYLTEGTIILKKHTEDEEELRVTGFSLDGDSVWTNTMRTSKKGFGASSTMKGWRQGISCSEQIPILPNAELYSEKDSVGLHQRLLVPQSEEGVFIESFEEDRDKCLVIYSDSLVSLIDNPRTTATSNNPDAWLSCTHNEMAYLAEIHSGSLEFMRPGDGVLDEVFKSDLHGCLDSIAISGYRSGEHCDVFTRRWALVKRWDETRPSGIGFLFDLDARRVVDTGSFRQPTRYVPLPDERGLVRFDPQSLAFLDSALSPIHIIPVSPKIIKSLRRAGDWLVGYDSITTGVLHVVDLRALTYSRRVLRLDNQELEPMQPVRKSMWGESSVWIDGHDVVYVVHETGAGAASVSAIGLDGHVEILSTGNEADVYFSTTSDGAVKVSLAAAMNRRMTNSYAYRHGSIQTFEYNAQTHQFTLAELMDEPQMSFNHKDRHIERMGKTLWELGNGFGSLCGDFFYSRFRAVDHYERFPLYGKDVIRLVREEKQFGEFWTHINAEPLIAKVLLGNSVGYKAGHSFGSFMRSTWAKLGLLLGACALAYASWSGRQRLRAT